jgi:hypothetical protein
MSGAMLLRVVGLITVVLSSVGPVTASAQTKREPTQATDPGRVVLVNTRADSVRVEVRSGPSAICDQNPSLGVRTIGRDRTWTISSAEHICWRREPQAGTNSGAAQTWTHRALIRGSEERVEF